MFAEFALSHRGINGFVFEPDFFDEALESPTFGSVSIWAMPPPSQMKMQCSALPSAGWLRQRSRLVLVIPSEVAERAPRAVVLRKSRRDEWWRGVFIRRELKEEYQNFRCNPFRCVEQRPETSSRRRRQSNSELGWPDLAPSLGFVLLGEHVGGASRWFDHEI